MVFILFRSILILLIASVKGNGVEERSREDHIHSILNWYILNTSTMRLFIMANFRWIWVVNK